MNYLLSVLLAIIAGVIGGAYAGSWLAAGAFFVVTLFFGVFTALSFQGR